MKTFGFSVFKNSQSVKYIRLFKEGKEFKLLVVKEKGWTSKLEEIFKSTNYNEVLGRFRKIIMKELGGENE